MCGLLLNQNGKSRDRHQGAGRLLKLWATGCARQRALRDLLSIPLALWG